ncbi:aldo/keto reductase [Subtercola boreus]|uniref:Alcohol dehydrogenase n=1 Tax=Subtercola boreus TaxID=120213 RepID=A0A3E0W6N4_9MICO|nr:aldo/keto reductase [Subtercola boreus]RFA18184.1 alcohol dehydrogenase [Subtercola boreus]RFA18576.1 alcohol dehydrogenase [Subtercola boreus]RFA25094.1 alcohol dehydrogenase [Subtercola boreus]
MPRIGASDLDVFPLSLGGNVFGWTADRSTSFDILDAYAAAGGDFIDTADSYSAFAPGNHGGESETLIGEWMTARGNRDKFVVATKVSRHPDYMGLAAANIAAAADASLARLGVDTIDLYFAHFDDDETPLDETAGAFDELVKCGKVRYIGLSNYSPERIEAYFEVARANGFALPVALQPHYNLVHRNEYEEQYAPLAERENLGVVPYFALASGFLTGKYRSADDLAGTARSAGAAKYATPQGLAIVDALDEIGSAHGASITTTALAWLLAKPTITAPIASASKVGQVADLVAAPNLALTPEEVARLDDVSAWHA